MTIRYFPSISNLNSSTFWIAKIPKTIKKGMLVQLSHNSSALYVQPLNRPNSFPPVGNLTKLSPLENHPLIYALVIHIDPARRFIDILHQEILYRLRGTTGLKIQKISNPPPHQF